MGHIWKRRGGRSTCTDGRGGGGNWLPRPLYVSFLRSRLSPSFLPRHPSFLPSRPVRPGFCNPQFVPECKPPTTKTQTHTKNFETIWSNQPNDIAKEIRNPERKYTSCIQHSSSLTPDPRPSSQPHAYPVGPSYSICILFKNEKIKEKENYPAVYAPLKKTEIRVETNKLKTASVLRNKVGIKNST